MWGWWMDMVDMWGWELDRLDDGGMVNGDGRMDEVGIEDSMDDVGMEIWGCGVGCGI